MFETLRNAWKIKDLRTKILWTLLALVIYRFGSFIPVAGVNPAYIQQMTQQYDLLGFLNIMSGGAFENFTILALGISPYINASIIINLLTIAIPALEKLAKEGGEEGRKKIERYTRYSGMALGLVTSIGIVVGLGKNAVLPISTFPLWFSYLNIGLTLTAGTAFLMWLGEIITQIGITNGMSLLIFIGIIARAPTAIITFFKDVFAGNISFWLIPVVIVLVVALVAFVALIDVGQRRIPVQYAKRVVGRKMYGGQSTHIPMRVNPNGVIPLIFAMTLMQLPAMIAQFWPTSAFYVWYRTYLGSGTPIYMILYFLLILGFSFFYTAVTFNPIEMSKNLQANGGFIPGIRPGKPTSDYLARISNRLTMFSGVFLALIAAIPTLFTSLLGQQSVFGATALLIMVSVALETSKSLEAQLTMRHYKGFLK